MLLARKITDDVYDNFVKEHANGHMLQLASWAQVKADNWYAEKIALFNDEVLVATCLMLFRKIGFGQATLCYVPKGYVGDYNDLAVAQQLIVEMKRVAKANKAMVIDFEMNALVDASPMLVELFEKAGFKHNGHTTDSFMYQNQYDMIVHFDEQATTLDCLNKLSKSQLKKGLEAKLDLVKGTIEDTLAFTRLSDETGERKGISLRNQAYYTRILETLDSDIFLVRAYKDYMKQALLASQNAAKEDIVQLELKLEKNLTEKKRASVSNEIGLRQQQIDKLQVDLQEIEDLEDDSIDLAGCLVVYCGKDAYYLYAASTDRFRYLQPNIFMNYSIMDMIREKGYQTYNLGGIKQKGDPLYMFKERLGGQVTEYEGVLSYVANKPLYRLFKLALATRKKLRAMKHKKQG